MIHSDKGKKHKHISEADRERSWFSSWDIKVCSGVFKDRYQMLKIEQDFIGNISPTMPNITIQNPKSLSTILRKEISKTAVM